MGSGDWETEVSNDVQCPSSVCIKGVGQLGSDAKRGLVIDCEAWANSPKELGGIVQGVLGDRGNDIESAGSPEGNLDHRRQGESPVSVFWSCSKCQIWNENYARQWNRETWSEVDVLIEWLPIDFFGHRDGDNCDSSHVHGPRKMCFCIHFFVLSRCLARNRQQGKNQQNCFQDRLLLFGNA